MDLVGEGQQIVGVTEEDAEDREMEDVWLLWLLEKDG